MWLAAQEQDARVSQKSGVDQSKAASWHTVGTDTSLLMLVTKLGANWMELRCKRQWCAAWTSSLQTQQALTTTDTGNTTTALVHECQVLGRWCYVCCMLASARQLPELSSPDAPCSLRLPERGFTTRSRACKE